MKSSFGPISAPSAGISPRIKSPDSTPSAQELLPIPTGISARISPIEIPRLHRKLNSRDARPESVRALAGPTRKKALESSACRPSSRRKFPRICFSFGSER